MMLHLELTVLCLSCVALSRPLLRHDSDQQLESRLLGSQPYTIPAASGDLAARRAAIAVTRVGYLYGPAVGGGPYYPTGPLGAAAAALDVASVAADTALVLGPAQTADYAQAELSVPEYGQFTTLDDYAKLYNGEWTRTAPQGIDSGMLTNYTQDLLFSMERLSTNPYAVRRLKISERLPFQVDTTQIPNTGNKTLQELHAGQYLFYADHSDQKHLPRTKLAAAACDAYFYISPVSGDFLPLAIRTNVGKNLVYTPLDTANDWLLAKIMFNVNDFWQGQWYHLASTHEVVEIVWQAAVRTLSSDHPVYGILDRLTFQAFAFRPLAVTLLFTPGGIVDNTLPFTGQSAQTYSSNLYTSGAAGSFQNNYFLTNLRSRGLIDSTGPSLKHFPFYEDGSSVYNSIREFMTSLVSSYYPNPNMISQDEELQAWVREATPAKIIDFPSKISSVDTLVDILTHIAFLVSPAHASVNQNELISASLSLPFHPGGLSQPVPKSKGVTDVTPFLPDIQASLRQLQVGALFSRFEFQNTNRSLLHMFDSPTLLARMNKATRQAASRFKAEMKNLSNAIGARTFDTDGLSQGMPFLWKALDPNQALFSLSV